jgi:hypothetical protein
MNLLAPDSKPIMISPKNIKRENKHKIATSTYWIAATRSKIDLFTCFCGLWDFTPSSNPAH